MSDVQDTTENLQPSLGFLDPQSIFRHVGVGAGMVVADLGCGTGYLSLPLAKRVGSEGKVYAVDVRKDTLSAIHDRAMTASLQNVQTVWADLEMAGSTRIQDASVDIAFLVNIFFQLEDKKTPFAEAKRIVKKGGKIVVVDWNDSSSFGPAENARIQPEDIQRMSVELGLAFVSDFIVDRSHFGLIFMKP